MEEQKIFTEQRAQEVGKMIDSSQRIAIISHRNPDGDTSGSGMAMREVLTKRGKHIENICVDALPTAFLYMPGTKHYVQDFIPSHFDLIITVDAATREQTGFADLRPEIFSGNIPCINIDHHISNEMFGVINLVEAEACSTTAVLWKLFETLDWYVSPDAATCLMNGLMTDTGSLQHSNSTPESFRIAGKIMSAGADLSTLRQNVFRSTPVSTLRLWGEILTRATLDSSGVVTSTVREEDFTKTGATPKDAAGAIDYLNMVPNAEYALLMTEIRGKVKGSFRTQQDDVNVSDLAGLFGGGGHVKAAGFTVPGRLQIEKRFTIIPDTEEAKGEKQAV